MKKQILSAVFSIILFSAGAQSQRLVLVEEFTQASCPPCSQQNPGFNALLNANAGKVVSIKYQTDWPGSDPMNAQNPTQVQKRVTYYNVTGVPYGRTDGTEISNTCSAYAGAPACLNQAKINNAYAIPSPFTINVSYNYSASFDSIFVTCVITATQSVTLTSPVAHIVLREKEILFATAPGSNGETLFEGVMKKMLPTDQGTPLVSTWAVNDVKTITVKAPVPSYVYNINQLDVVAFIQDNATKNIKQAGYASSQPVTVDAGITLVSSPNPCATVSTFTPSVTIRNFGSDTLKSCTINYHLDAATNQTYTWTGSLAPFFKSAVIMLPAIPVTIGAHTFTSFTSNPNGSADGHPYNDQVQSSFNIMSNVASTQAPYTEGFENSGFPYSDNYLTSQNGMMWAQGTSASFSGSGALKLDNFSATTKDVDEFITPAIDMSAIASPAMTFQLAHARLSSSDGDQLSVFTSSNCGASWTQRYSKSAAALANAGAMASAFTPSSQSQWRQETVNISNVGGQSDVRFKFQFTSAGAGNNIYIDDINIADANAVAEEFAGGFDLSVFPNPFNDHATISFNILEKYNVSIGVYDMVGKEVLPVSAQTELSAGNYSLPLNRNVLKPGIYFVKLSVDGYSVIKKVIVQ